MITSRIQGWARAHPAKIALIHNDASISYSSFARAIEAARVFLAQQQIPAGRTAVVLVNDLRDAWILVLALRALGLTTIAVQSIAQAAQLDISDVACTVLTQHEIQGGQFEAKSLADSQLIVLPTSIHAKVQVGALPSPQQNAPAFGGHILYTSGTTGTYKKVLCEGNNDDERNEREMRMKWLNEDTVFHMLNFGLWTIAGFGYPSAVWWAGGCVVFDQRKDCLKNLSRHPITKTFLTPALLREVLRTPATAPRLDFEVLVGGGFLPLALAEETRRQLTDRITSRYGSTECSGVLYSRFERSEDVHWLTSCSDRIVQIVDEDGNECLPGSEGDLRVRLNGTDATAYLDDSATSARFFRDGCFYPGDRAVKRADGRIRILGRTADVLNVQGLKIAVAPLEDALQRHLQLDAVCLFSGLNDDGKDELVIAIQSQCDVPRHQLDAIAELDAVGPVVAAFGSCRCLVLTDFPRTKTGMSKIDRAALKRRVFPQAH